MHRTLQSISPERSPERLSLHTPIPPATHVVILGGGFGGRDAAARLARLLPRTAHITLVDRNPYLLYTPMLTEVAGRSVAPSSIQGTNLPARVELVVDEITAADLTTRTVTLGSGRTLTPDHLLIALGSTTNFREVEGAREHSVTMKTLDDARRVRTLAQRHVELAAMEPDSARRKRLLTIVVAGGGYTGVETIASVNDLVSDTASRLHVPLSELNLILIEPSDSLMSEMPQALRTYGKQQLENSGIQVMLGAEVQKVEGTTVSLADGSTLETELLIWDTGITPAALIATLGAPLGEKHGLAVESTFALPGFPGVWAIGDCAEIPKPFARGKFFEPTAQNATREGTLVAENIVAKLCHRPLRPFTYKQIGELAVVSRSTGVANVFGLELTGVLAWLMWRGIYLAKMPGLRQKCIILADWIRLAFGRRYVPLTRRLPRTQTEFTRKLIDLKRPAAAS